MDLEAFEEKRRVVEALHASGAITKKEKVNMLREAVGLPPIDLAEEFPPYALLARAAHQLPADYGKDRGPCKSGHAFSRHRQEPGISGLRFFPCESWLCMFITFRSCFAYEEARG